MTRKHFYGNREKQYQEARRLRKSGYGYRSISSMVGVNFSTVRNWVNDIPADKELAFQKSLKRKKIPLEKLKSKDAIRRRLIEIRGNTCEMCGLSEWLENKIPLEMHRKNGKGSPYTDTENIQLLCPNCHTLTPDYKKSV